MKNFFIDNTDKNNPEVVLQVPKFEEKRYKLDEVKDKHDKLELKKARMMEEMESLDTELNILKEIIKKSNG